MKRVRVVSIINNYGEERYIIQHTIRVSYWIFWMRDKWINVTFVNSDDPYFYPDYTEALLKAKDILENANPRKQRIITQTKVEEIEI